MKLCVEKTVTKEHEPSTKVVSASNFLFSDEKVYLESSCMAKPLMLDPFPNRFESCLIYLITPGMALNGM